MAEGYELVVVYDARVGEEQIPHKIDGVRTLIGSVQGQVTDVMDWGRRRLAYPINHQFEGYYVITQFDAPDPRRNVEVERALNIDESVLRYLIFRRDN